MARAARLLPWPLPALLAWGAGWALFVFGQRLGLPAWAALALGTLAGVAGSLATGRWWRRILVAAGFPLSLALSGAAQFAAWTWLLPLGLLLLVYPVHAWRDAPIFPTPAGALDGLARAAPLPPGASVLDAGCGLGDGLIALRSAYPQARLQGTERSWPLRIACALRCPWARVRQGDLWRDDWSGHALVYLFQRPESMSRAWAKARAEMAPGSWLASLEFPVDAREAPGGRRLPVAAGRTVWLYRVP